MVQRDDEELSLKKRCELMGVSRSTMYYRKKEKKVERLDELVELLKQIHEDHPCYGRRRLYQMALKSGFKVSQYQIRQLMKEHKIVAIVPKRSLSRANKMHKKYPYLLKGMEVTQPNQVWATDITYIRLQGGYVYMMAIIDLYSRKILSWGISNTQDASFCVNLLSNALEEFGKPEVFNSDQGSQYTSKAFTGLLAANDIQISMDGVGRALDNIFIERFWRTLKYEDIHIRDYQNLGDCRRGVRKFIQHYNSGRLHQSLDYSTPDEIYCGYRISKAITPDLSWANSYAPMEKMEFEECVRIFKNGIGRGEHLRAA
jgi:putative transposase